MIAVVSDTHASINKVINELIPYHPKHLFFLGDFYTDGLHIAKHLDISVDAVIGNCDGNTSIDAEEKVIQIENFKFLLVHGHKYKVKVSFNRLFYRAEELGVDMVVFGHTHVPYLGKINNIWMMNPGSPTIPRNGSKASYGIINCDGNTIQPSIIELS